MIMKYDKEKIIIIPKDEELNVLRFKLNLSKSKYKSLQICRKFFQK